MKTTWNYDWTTEGATLAEGDSPNTFASIEFNPALSDKDQADIMHKIASAPDLLESLIALRDMFIESHQSEIDGGHGGDDSCSYCEAIEHANKAIQKATGEA